MLYLYIFAGQCYFFGPQDHLENFTDDPTLGLCIVQALTQTTITPSEIKSKEISTVACSKVHPGTECATTEPRHVNQLNFRVITH